MRRVLRYHAYAQLAKVVNHLSECVCGGSPCVVHVSSLQVSQVLVDWQLEQQGFRGTAQ